MGPSTIAFVRALANPLRKSTRQRRLQTLPSSSPGKPLDWARKMTSFDVKYAAAGGESKLWSTCKTVGVLTGAFIINCGTILALTPVEAHERMVSKNYRYCPGDPPIDPRVFGPF